MNTNNTSNNIIPITNYDLNNDINNNKIISLKKSKLENENTINLLQKSLKNINISNQELKQENSILKAKLKNKDIFLEKLEIEHLKDESELNSLKKINMNLSEELDNIKLKNKSIIEQLNKKDLLIEKLNQNKEERENKLINTQILISNAVKDYELYIQLNNKYENDIKKLKSKIKFFKDENTKLENINKSLNNKIVQYEQNIMQLKTELLKCCQKGIKIFGYIITEDARNSFNQCQNYYRSNGGSYEICEFKITEEYSDSDSEEYKHRSKYMEIEYKKKCKKKM